jgi:hypothetical protein
MSFTGRIRSAGRVSLPVLAIQECQRYPKSCHGLGAYPWRVPMCVSITPNQLVLATQDSSCPPPKVTGCLIQPWATL